MQNDSTVPPADARPSRPSLGDVIDLGSPSGIKLALALAAVLRSLPTAPGCEPTPPAPPKQRQLRPSPKRLAKWEAHWAAEAETVEGDR